jgi:hypothetical protein
MGPSQGRLESITLAGEEIEKEKSRNGEGGGGEIIPPRPKPLFPQPQNHQRTSLLFLLLTISFAQEEQRISL